MAQQQDAQHQRGGLARPGPCHHAGGRCVAEYQLPLRGTGLRLGGQALGDIGLEALFQLGSQGQAPVIEQVVIPARHRGGVGPGIADHQHLAPGLVTFHPPAFEPFTHAIGMATALAAGVAEEPGVAVLGLQAGQATPQQAGRQAAKPGQLGRRGKVGRGLGLLVGHGHSVEKQNQRACSPHRQKIASECLQISGLGDEADKNPHKKTSIK
ncbi:hypothetical protein D3C81_1534970 [compost metagenome]